MNPIARKTCKKLNNQKSKLSIGCAGNNTCQKIYIIVSTSENLLKLDVEIETTDMSVKRRTNALVDSSTTGLFMDSEYVHANAINTRQLSSPIPVFNIDSSVNEAGEIREVAEVIL
jgi:hypothetical protein